MLVEAVAGAILSPRGARSGPPRPRRLRQVDAYAAVVLLLALLLGLPSAARAQPAAAPEPEPELAISLRIVPAEPTYGRVHEAEIEIQNLSQRPRRVEVKAMLGEVAHFVGGGQGLRFEHPDQPAQERVLIWPEQSLAPLDRVKLSFGFLVSWDVRGDLFLSTEARDVEAGEAMPLAVAHLRQAPVYPSSSGAIEFVGLAINALIGLTVVAILVLPLIWQRLFKRPLILGRSLRQKIALVAAVLLILISGSMIWDELEPRWQWKTTRCEVLDVRYSVQAETSSNRNVSQRTTFRRYYPLLALRYQAGEKLIISTGYKVNAQISEP